MVTGVPVNDLLHRFGNHGLSHEEIVTVLTEYGILPRMIDMDEVFMADGVYFLTMPSLNIPRALHRVVAVSNDADDIIKVYDPNQGRPDKVFYEEDCLFRRMKGGSERVYYSDPIFLKPLRLHRGTEERLALYAQRALVSEEAVVQDS
jgi:hypothetical protein